MRQRESDDNRRDAAQERWTKLGACQRERCGGKRARIGARGVDESGRVPVDESEHEPAPDGPRQRR